MNLGTSELLKSRINRVAKRLKLSENEIKALLFLRKKGSVSRFRASYPSISTILKLCEYGYVSRQHKLRRLRRYEAGITKFTLSSKGDRICDSILNR
jgi:hypothetical protein